MKKYVSFTYVLLKFASNLHEDCIKVYKDKHTFENEKKNN